jgi:hypothetical protein
MMEIVKIAHAESFLSSNGEKCTQVKNARQKDTVLLIKIERVQLSYI